MRAVGSGLALVPCVVAGAARVLPAGGAPDTQASADVRAATEYSAALRALKEIAGVLKASPSEVRPQADGTNDYLVQVARETREGDTQQYFPPTLRIAAGDS